MNHGSLITVASQDEVLELLENEIQSNNFQTLYSLDNGSNFISGNFAVNGQIISYRGSIDMYGNVNIGTIFQGSDIRF